MNTEPEAGYPRRRHWVGRVQGGVLLDTPLRPQRTSRCWVAVLSPDDRAPGGWARTMFTASPYGRGYVAARSTTGVDGRRQVTAMVSPGDVVEFGADYTRTTRRRGRLRSETVPVRWYGLVLATKPDAVDVWGPYRDPAPAWDDAQEAMKEWRESRNVSVRGVTDRPGTDFGGRPDPARELPRPAVEVRVGADVARVDDPVHGTLEVDSAAFGAAMTLSREQLADLLAGDAPDLGLGGDESKQTLAALAARDAPWALPAEPVLVADEPPAAEYLGRPDATVVRRDPAGGDVVLRPPRRFTPDGFGWGHDAETACELGHALIADATGRPEAARLLAAPFASEVLSTLTTGRPWSIAVDDVRAWATVAGPKAGLDMSAAVPGPTGPAAEVGL